MNASRITQWLLPPPKQTNNLPGNYAVSHGGLFVIEVEDQRIHRAADRWRRLAGFESALRIRIDKSIHPNPEAYLLQVQPTEIELTGTTPTGCFWGLQTLSQLTDLATGFPDSAKEVSRVEIPCCSILDWPDMAIRGVLHDVTRGKVPTLLTLRTLVDRLSTLKINQLQLYIEHAFTFSFDPEICGADEGLTPEEICELNQYCRERFIDLVPALATFGHMGRILSMQKYRHLAEIEPTLPWKELSWPARARGFTLDCLNPESHRLVERMWSDVLDAFPGPIVNICGDEPWDLGKGKNRDRLEGTAKYHAYVEHLERTQRICASRGRQTQFWSDVIRSAPNLKNSSLRDSTVLHWGYDDRADYKGTAELVQQGFSTVVCPGTSGWKRILNGMNLAERNICDFVAAARSAGAVGLIITDWGDHGHFNSLAGSWHGFALGAALSWNNDSPIGAELDEKFARSFFKTNDPALLSLLRQVAKISDACETWRLLWMNARETGREPTLPNTQLLLETLRQAQEAGIKLKHCGEIGGDNRLDSDELSMACKFTELLCRKLNWVSKSTASSPSWPTFSERKNWGDELLVLCNDYAVCWTARNKPFGLQDILGALRKAADDVLEFQEKG
ncbi:MAG: family 20 glycosylhydrolase [Planctomycetota bacterium]